MTKHDWMGLFVIAALAQPAWAQALAGTPPPTREQIRADRAKVEADRKKVEADRRKVETDRKKVEAERAEV